MNQKLISKCFYSLNLHQVLKNNQFPNSIKEFVQPFFFYLIFTFFLIQSFINCASIGAPTPFIQYDLDYLEIGSVMFLPATNTLTNGQYLTIATITFTKMNKYAPNNFAVYFGWRGIDITLQTQTDGQLAYSSRIVSKTSTMISVRCFMSKVSHFNFLNGNYLLVHEQIVNNRLIIGKQMFSTTPCIGIDPTITNSPNCIYPVTISLLQRPQTFFISITSIKMFRNNDSAKRVIVRLILTKIDQNTINIGGNFGLGGRINQISIDVIYIDSRLRFQKRTLNIEFFDFNSGISSVPMATFSHTFQNNVFDFNLFTTLRFIGLDNNNFHYLMSIDTNNIIKLIRNNIGTAIVMRNFIFYSNQCPSDAFFFSNQNQVCEVCPGPCIQCQLNIKDQVECLNCGPNFTPSDDKLSCECSITEISGICDDFAAFGLNDCKNAQRSPTGVQCVFCNPNLFQIALNNQCVCKSGYKDSDNDGICQEICGDGIIINAQCDDGNTNSNDGCSSTCSKEAGFLCDSHQPTYCSSEMPLVYKLGFIDKVQSENKGQIILRLFNSLSSLPFDFNANYFQPSSIHVRLFLIESQSPFKQIEIIDKKLQDLSSGKDMHLEFTYGFTVEKLSARIEIDYSKTKYSNYVQKLSFQLNSINSPLIYSKNLETFTTISIVLCVGTVLSMLGLIIGLCSPKYIGLESLLTLQLIFYSQLLIANPSKWPVGFMYLKYLKFTSGYNDILSLTEYVPFSIDAKKLQQVDIKKTILQNFNTNFVLLGLSFLVFSISLYLKYTKESQMRDIETLRKEALSQNHGLNSKDADIFDEVKRVTSEVNFWERVSEKIFWIINHLSVWSILPLTASMAAQIVIGNDLVDSVSFEPILSSNFGKFGRLIAFISSFIIVVICMNNFKNIFLSQDTLKKILLKPEEKTYKALLIIYLCTTGSIVIFFNDATLFKVPMSVLMLLLQLLYIITLIIIHPYKQSLRIHTITLLINQCVFIVFLAFINLINMVEEIDELLVIIMGYFITGCCGFLMLLTGIRLYFELRYGQALEKQIQKEREQEEKRQKKLEEEKLERMKKKLESQAKKKQSQKEIERATNPFLYENQVKEDEAKDVIEWLERCNWETQEKEKYFFSKFTGKPLDWLQRNNQEEYLKLMEMRRKENQNKKERGSQSYDNEKHSKLRAELRKQAVRNEELLRRQLKQHKKRLVSDGAYSMSVMKQGMEKFIGQGYTLAD